MEDTLQERLYKEGLELASIKSRMLAYVIDDILITLIILAIFWNDIAMSDTYEQAINIVNSALLEIVLLRILYQALFVSIYGATLGKMALKIRVVVLDMLDTPSVTQSVLRSVVRAANEILLYVGFIFGIFDPNKQTMHDKFSNTIVVNAI